MNIVLTASESIVTEAAFKKANKNTSFSSILLDEDLKGFGAALLHSSSQPTAEPGKKVVADGIQEVDGKWYEKWAVVDMTADDTAAMANTVRKDRNLLLQDSDWTQVGDSTVADTWKPYRQALRDIPQAAGFPHAVTWPTKPN